MQKTKVLFLLPYPLKQAPSQRFRIEAYFPLLEANNIIYDTETFLSEEAWKVLYKGGSSIKKMSAVVNGFFNRCWVAFKSRKYDFIVVHREATPLGPPIFEWILAKVFHKKLIFDFDDAIWIPNISANNKLARYIKCFWKIKYICKWSYKIAAGNDYLANWARQYNNDVIVCPTCVDTTNRYNLAKERVNSRPVIGWTGSHSTLKYLDAIYPVMTKLSQEFEFDFLVICDQPPLWQLAYLQFIKWNERTEIKDLLHIDIGLMPLDTDPWSEGKCGFKLIQYMALGIPALASPVGVNKQIIEHNKNGFLCSAEEDWYNKLKLLIQDESLRKQFGQSGQKKIRLHYSIESNSLNFLSLFSE